MKLGFAKLLYSRFTILLFLLFIFWRKVTKSNPHSRGLVGENIFGETSVSMYYSVGGRVGGGSGIWELYHKKNLPLLPNLLIQELLPRAPGWFSQS